MLEKAASVLHVCPTDTYIKLGLKGQENHDLDGERLNRKMATYPNV